MKSICVFAGSANGSNEIYSLRAKDLGLEIAKRDLSMVYGGGSKGLMGVVADAALSGGASVTGVITEKLHDIEVGHNSLTSLEIVKTMHERKSRMAQLSDAIISLPGGVGTWEEFFEALAWNQLGIYSKPIVLFDVDAECVFPTDSIAIIASEGLLGGNFLEIIPGGNSDELKSGDMMEFSQDAVDISQLLGKFMFSSAGNDHK